MAKLVLMKGKADPRAAKPEVGKPPAAGPGPKAPRLKSQASADDLVAKLMKMKGNPDPRDAKPVAGKSQASTQTPKLTGINPKPAGNGSAAWIWIVIAIIAVIFIFSGAAYMNKNRPQEARPGSFFGPPLPPGATPPQEKMWMGDWMKETGAITNEMLRARQERIKSAPRTHAATTAK